MPRFLLRRYRSSVFGTFGLFFFSPDNGSPLFIGYSLEPVVCDGAFQRGLLAGSYALDFTFSPRFKRKLPLIIADGRSGLRIHPLNYASESKGCIGVGLRAHVDHIEESRAAVDTIISYIETFKVKKLVIDEIVSL